MLKWLVAALGAFLAVAGALTAMQGWEIVQVERGWSQVIAGSVAATGGCMILALAAVAARIDALLASVEQIRRGALPVVTPVAVEVARSRPAARPAAPPADEPMLPFDSAPSQGESPAMDAPGQSAETSPASIEPATVEPPRPPPTARVRSSWLPRSRAARANSAKERDGREPDPFGDTPYGAIPPRETDLPTGPWPDFEAPPSAPSAAAMADGIDASGASPATLVRRYESGGVSYQLYSDGSIEAQTESGSYRFNSLAELRTFIEDKR